MTGLARGDFEVFEDRRRQTISVFAGPGAGRASAPASSAIAPPAVPRPVDAGLPRVVALAFEQLGPASRALAAQAARRLVDALGPGDFAAVFTIDRAVQPVLGYAPPSPAVGTAIDAAASRAGLPLRRAGLVPGAEFQSVEAGQPTPETRDEAKRTRGFATLDALSQIVQGLSLLPGRKMVVLFSEGLALDASEEVAQMPRADGPQPLDDTWLTDGRFTRFQRLVEQANAAQVAFYTFDAAGLRTDGPFSAAGFGRAPYVGLLALAEGTGGAFVESTNDLAPGARRAAADQASYYVLGYSPSKAADGTYRQLRVRARCDGCTVLARRGYRATPAGPLRQVGVRDVAALLALEAGTVAADLDVTLETMPGPSPGPRTLSVRATLPESAVTPGGVVTFLARVTDGGGRAVALVSQHFERRGSSGPGARLTFERTVPVPAGGARLELCVYDHATRRATVLRRGYDPSQ